MTASAFLNTRKTRAPLPRPIRYLAHRWHWVFMVIPLGLFAVLAGGTRPSTIAAWLHQNSQALAGLQNIVQAVFLIAAGTLAYDRFFRGRTGVSRAELGLTIKVLDRSTNRRLHIAELRFKNVGTPSIWSPAPELRMRGIGPDTNPTSPEWELLTLSESLPFANDVVDSGETVVFCAFCQVPDSIWAVEYEAIVRDHDGTPWMAKVITPNE